MSINTLVAMLGIGVMAGIMSGVFGVGGGLVIVPMLVLAMGYQQHTANGTSLVALLGPVGLMGVIAYYRAGKIDMSNIKAGLLIAAGLFAGAYVGAYIAMQISSEGLRKIFAVFLVLVALRMWFQG